MTFIEVQCEFGHRSQADVRLAGQTLPCPKCQGPVKIPQTKDPFSDTGVMRILGEAELNAAKTGGQSPPTSATRPCPRCAAPVNESQANCPQCECYLGVAPNFLRQLT